MKIVRRTLQRIALSSLVVVAAEAVVAILDGGPIGPAPLERFRLWISVTAAVVLVGTVLAWSAGPGPKVWNLAGGIPVSSGTRRMWDTGSYAKSESSSGTLPVAFGTGLVLAGIALVLFGLG